MSKINDSAKPVAMSRQKLPKIKQVVVIQSDSENQFDNSQPRKRPKLQKQQSLLLIKFDKGPIANTPKPSLELTPALMIPWINRNTKSITDSLLRFHNEIIDFYRYIKPSQQEHQRRMIAFSGIKGIILNLFPGVSVQIFGSFATKLYLPDGDIDIVILTNGRYQASDVYTKIHKRFLIQPNQYTDLQYIRQSKVPLIKFIYKYEQLELQFDISVDKPDGLYQLEYVNKMMRAYPEFKYLVFIFKCFLKIRGLGQTYTGGVGSFLLFCMILFHLQQVHRNHKYLTLGEHTLQFMKYYGETDWSKKVIHIKSGVIGSRNRDDNSTFSCISPQDQSHDIGKAAFKIRDVFNAFKNRGRYITGKSFQCEESILKELVNPRCSCFKYLKETENGDDV